MRSVSTRTVRHGPFAYVRSSRRPDWGRVRSAQAVARRSLVLIAPDALRNALRFQSSYVPSECLCPHGRFTARRSRGRNSWRCCPLTWPPAVKTDPVITTVPISTPLLISLAQRRPHPGQEAVVKYQQTLDNCHPMLVYESNDERVVVDRYHRLEVAIRLGRTHIRADVRPGTDY